MPSSGSVEGAGVKYEVVHTTEYAYSGSVSVSHHIARLSPRTLPRQRCDSHVLVVDPKPEVITTHTDYFGNETTFFLLQSAHAYLDVKASSVVEVTAPARLEDADTPAWEVAADRSHLPLEAIECVFDTIPARLRSELAAYARRSCAPGRPLLDAVADLTARIHAEFTYDQTATTVATPLQQVFAERRGVCQDFARIEIACLRALGVPARYVSGYLETIAPPGEATLVGAAASHAWLSVHCPGSGWIDVDPTNNLFPSDKHITLAWGRGYGDVSPIRGVILGGGEHSLHVSVDVRRIDAPEPG